jgi:hypothetical protein
VRLVNLIWCRSVRGDVGTRFLASRKSHADTLLCAHYERPQWQLSPRPCAGAAEKFARAALTPMTSSRLGVGMTRLVNEQNIRTPQRIEHRACNDPGILTSDMKSISCGLLSMRVMCLEYSIRNWSF